MRTVAHQGQTYVHLDDVKENLERIREKRDAMSRNTQVYVELGMKEAIVRSMAKEDVLQWVLDMDWGED